MKLGVVAIGRNEGERLRRCLESVKHLPTVYVDSGSTDDSIKNAQALGVQVVELDLSVPFTAARARNAGFERLLQWQPDIEAVQFVDGDCELQTVWLEQAPVALGEDGVGVVCGRRREKFPDASIYNKVCDIEWNTPVGDAKACGGDAIYRVDVFKQVGGFDPSFIAGEEPELCFRIRQAGHRIQRLDIEMTLHDADMHAFSQWWNRAKRAGYAFTRNYLKHGRNHPSRHNQAQVKGIVKWAAIYSALVLLALVSVSIIPLLAIAAIILLQALRMTKKYHHRHQHEVSEKNYFIYSALIMIGKVPECLGVIKCWRDVKSGKQATLIEYK